MVAPFKQRFPDLTGVRVLVVGLGKSGRAAARLASNRGATIIATDDRNEAELGPVAEELRGLGAELFAANRPADLLDRVDLIVTSPGVPLTSELLVAARTRDLPVWGEVELAARYCRGRIIGITGSNGKSTVTSMVGHVLRSAGVPGGTGGNLATPFSELLELDSDDAVHAVELSSFQLETVETLAPTGVALLNLSPDHLDRHGSLEAYGEAKARLLELGDPDGFAVLNADDAASRPLHDRARGRRLMFSTRSEVLEGGFLSHGRLVLRTVDGDEDLMAARDLPLPGEHNVANALAAAICCRQIGCELDSIARGLQSYTPLPHRLEPVGRVGGVTYYNDSKATNPAATARALGAFAPGTVWLILGGRDKGADWSELTPLVKRQARQLLLVGECAEALLARFGAIAPVVRVGTIPDAVARAARDAEPGEVVLLAPGCASFDQYRNFEERGEDFRRAVGGLTARGEDDA